MKQRHTSPGRIQKNPVYLHSIGTAVPQHRLAQSEILDFMQRLQADTPEKAAFMQKVYAGSSIETRYSVLGDYRREWPDFDFYPRNAAMEPSPGTARRNEVFVREADKLALLASKNLFDPHNIGGLQIDPSAITHLITVSCTGFSAPGFDLSLQKDLGLSAELHRFHLGFMGCYAAFPALKLAWNLCRADHAARVLIVDVEICTLHFQKTWETDTVVANALFADGAAAALVSAQAKDSIAPLFALRDFSTRMVAGSGDEMAWIIGDTGFDMKLSAYVPRVIDANMPQILDGMLERNRLQRNDIGAWAIHPGGRSILDKLARSLALPPTALDESYQVLRDYGNMSSATIFFVLKAMAARPRRRQQLVFAAAFGPGLTVESALLCLAANRKTVARQPLFFPDLGQRLNQEELMDDPAINPVLLKRTVGQFGLLNRLFSAYRSILKREIFSRMTEPDREYRLLDIGAGGGDIPLWLMAEAKRRGRKLRITCIDQDERIIPWAQAAVADCPGIEVLHARAEDLAGLGQFDFLFCNHLLHHLAGPVIVGLIAAAHRQSRINFVFNDLKRSLWAYIGYTIFTGLFIRRSLAFTDGRLSIRRGFTKAELETLIGQAGLSGQLLVKTAAPARLYITRCLRP